MGTKKVAFEVSVGIPASTVKDFIADAEEFLQNQYDIEVKLADNEGFMKIMKEGILRQLSWSIESMYPDEVLDIQKLEKLFKKEIKAAEDKYEAECKAEEAARQKARAATLARSGVLRMSPDQLATAQKVLREAGIEASIN